MKADIWAFGLVVFSLTNPGLKHPFEVDMLTCIGTYTHPCNAQKFPEIKRVLDLLNANCTSQPTYFRIVFEINLVYNSANIHF